MRRAILAATVWTALAATPAAATEAAAVTQHQITIAGQPLKYTAEAGRVPIRDAETGEPHGFMFYTAYRVASKEPRPLTFVWNGGPGAASILLHFEAAGPRRIEAGRLIDNDDTWLTDTDLVFVDPIGTGFSRPAKAEYDDEFYGTVGDVASVTEFVRAWRRLHGEADSPVFLAGESWGAGRAASVGHALLKRGVPVAGTVLISGGSGLSAEFTTQGDLGALRMANLAATALFHGKLDPTLGDQPDPARAAAEVWVRETYIPALRRLSSLNDAEREAVAAGLARITGLPSSQINRKSLAVTPRQFRTTLLPGKTLDTFDMRLTAPVAERTAPVLLRYFAEDLGYRTDLSYIGLEDIDQGYLPNGKAPKSVNARWNYATGPVTPDEIKASIAEAQRTGAGPPQLGPPLPGTAEALTLNPKLKVLVATGLYDSLGNCAADAERARGLAPALKAAMSFRCYVGGHMMYRDPASRTALTRDVRALVAQ